MDEGEARNEAIHTVMARLRGDTEAQMSLSGIAPVN